MKDIKIYIFIYNVYFFIYKNIHLLKDKKITIIKE
jgi:hypothetical protein